MIGSLTQPRSYPQFWVDLAREYSGPILELACGTGLIAIPIAQQGLAVTGIDQAATMLDAAVQKAKAAKAPVEFQQADMRAFDLGRTFTLILLLSNSICHLLTLADLEACLACVRKHLRPNGRFVVSVFVPSLTLLLKSPDERQPFSTYQDPETGEQVVVTHTSFYDPAAQITYNKLYYKVGRRDEQMAGNLNMRMYFPQELDALFKYNGFEIEHKYGDTERTQFNATSSTQIFVLKRHQ